MSLPSVEEVCSHFADENTPKFEIMLAQVILIKNGDATEDLKANGVYSPAMRTSLYNAHAKFVARQ